MNVRCFSILATLFALGCVTARPTPEQLGRVTDARACEGGSAEACVALGDAYAANAEQLRQRGQEIGERQRAAFELWSRACELGSSVGCEKSLASERAEEAVTALDQLCRRHQDVSRCVALAEHLERGTWPAAAVEPVRAREYLELACQGGDLERGCANLALSLEEGRGGEANRPRAFELHARVCEQAHHAPGACVQAGRMLLSGQHVEKDPDRATRYLGRACDRWDVCGWLASLYAERCHTGGTVACRELALLYREGRGVTADRDRAMRLAEKACQDADVPACRMLQEWSAPAPSP